MNRPALLKLLNPVLALVFFVQVVATIIAKYGGGDPLAWEIHEWAGYALGALIATHIVLNFPWIQATWFKRRR